MISLAACNRGVVQSNDAIRQGVLDHLAESQSKTSLNLAGMDVEVKSVQFNGKEADAAVSITPKGGNPAAGMSINYHLQQQGMEAVQSYLEGIWGEAAARFRLYAENTEPGPDR